MSEKSEQNNIENGQIAAKHAEDTMEVDTEVGLSRTCSNITSCPTASCQSAKGAATTASDAGEAVVADGWCAAGWSRQKHGRSAEEKLSVLGHAASA